MTEHLQHIQLPEGSIEKQTTTLNLGPTHPATHGVFQNIIELDGERIVSAESTVGYIGCGNPQAGRLSAGNYNGTGAYFRPPDL